RNPWRFSFDSMTGNLYISDVGEWIHEEINYEPAGFAGGANYGWRCFEGTYDQTIDHPIYAEACQGIENNTFPVHEYTHADTLGCSVTGGFVYRGQRFPVLDGYYVFSDFCSGQIWALREIRGSWQSFEMGKLPFISTFGEDVNGELYVGTWSPNGDPPMLYRLEAR
ncbi:MAG: PQQ-dependent sugar dehydrogenase, partial [Chloroflexota bacterium]